MLEGDTFNEGWVTYCIRQDRKLALTANPYSYEAASVNYHLADLLRRAEQPS